MDVRAVVAAFVFCLMALQQAGGRRQHRPANRNKNKKGGCGQAADMVFVLDVSSSIWEVDFRDHVLTFVRNVTRELNVGSGKAQSQVAAITFSDIAKMEFPLNRYLNKRRLLEAVLRIKSRGGNTNTHLALQFVDEKVFRPEKGARANVSRVVVIITDGMSREGEATREAARVLKEHGAIIFAIGVGNERNRSQLVDMASRPADEYVVELTEFRNLDKKIKDKLVYKACQVTTTTTSTTATTTTTTTPSTTTTVTTTPSTTTTTSTTMMTTTPVSSTDGAPDIPFADRPVDTGACVNLPADVYFVLDSSSSIWEYDFHHNVLGFVRAVINLYDVGRYRTRVGVITYSNTAQKIFGLNTFLRKDKLDKAVREDHIQYTPGGTNTALALQEAGDQLQQEGRPGVQQIVILITDGQSQDPSSTVTTARALRPRGVRVLAVGVGESVDETELKAVAGDNAVMMVGNFNSLAQLSSLLAARSCAPPGDIDIPEIPIKDSPNRCSLGAADVIVAFDWSTLGAPVVSDITTTLHHLTLALEARGTDVRLGIMTSRSCLRQQVVPLSSGEVLGKYTRRSGGGVVRSRLHRVLKTVRVSAFSASNGRRPTARKVVMMVLDSASTSVIRQMGREAAKMRNDGVEIFAVIDSASGRKGGELVQDIVSAPAWGHVIPLLDLDFSNVAFATETIVSYLCGDNRANYYV